MTKTTSTANLPGDLADLVSRPPIYHLLCVAEKIRGKHLNHVWKGLAGIPNGDEPALPVVVKHLPRQSELDIELACGLAAQVLKLPVPAPAIVIAETDDLPDHPASLSAGRVILYGSLFQASDSFHARNTSSVTEAHDHIWSKVCENAVAPMGAAWDELVANPDRHAQNFLFDGQKWWLFDHNMALQPLAKMYANLERDSTQRQLIEHTARVNQIIDQLKQRRPLDHEVRAEAEKVVKQSKRLKMLAIAMDKWHVGDNRLDDLIRHSATIVNLIALRMEPLSLFIEKRLSTPDATSLWDD